ncbi:tRNA pseudouridine(38-40) synthase TruA [Plantibacter sp. ME-Dv--P-095]|uniref:tRNA pseudouridine(38-40) synthase TruA n=1 Tax=Plantibacter sp. ME-Dv--P-095 TaxID=3040299 RepID=UPI00254BE88D|nr:tRNA pseudouridine(38-40) synthase TruA [Plantibacter sp. ME-Dv--P-095]
MSGDASEAEGVLPAQRFKLAIAYDGTDFAGWAKQPGLRTVEGVLEEALYRVLGKTVPPVPRFVVAGRTDAGVHASGQVAHLDLTEPQLAKITRLQGRHAEFPDGSPRFESASTLLARRLNGVLGMDRDVVIHAAEPAPEGFDARFSAVWRHYRYRLADAGVRKDPIVRRTTSWTTSSLDLELLQQAAASLVGLHDFQAYCKPRPRATTIRTLQAFSWERDDAGVLVARLTADAFCHSMVRSLVGACVAVGEGRLSLEEVVRLRDGGHREIDFRVMPARGLTLVDVGYPEPGLLQSRAATTRQRRSHEHVAAGAD